MASCLTLKFGVSQTFAVNEIDRACDVLTFVGRMTVKEAFGPIAPIVRVPDNGEEIFIIFNSTDFGLTWAFALTTFFVPLRISRNLMSVLVRSGGSPRIESRRAPSMVSKIVVIQLKKEYSRR